MNKFILPLIFAFGLCLPRGAAFAAEIKPEDAAQPAAKEWLALVDGGKFVECWEKMSPGFKKKVSKRKWNSTVAEIRKPPGQFAARKLKAAEFSKELPGAPEGEYVVLQYDSTFAQKPHATEKVTLILGQDLNWRVCGYAVK